MRYRKLTPAGDYTFGQGPSEFLVNTPATVAQAVLTFMLLHEGEWFLDLTYGMPWETQVLGYNTGSLYDAAIKKAMLGVQGVRAIVSYQSNLDPTTRNLTVNARLDTIYGPTPVQFAIPGTSGGYGIGPYGQFPYGGG